MKNHLGASTTLQAAHTERLYKQTPLSFYNKGKHRRPPWKTTLKGAKATLTLGERFQNNRSHSRPPAAAPGRRGSGKQGRRPGRLCGLAPTAAQPAVPGRPHPGPRTPGPRRRSPGPAVHGHMSLRGRRRPAPARPHAAWDALLRAAAGPRRPPRPRGDSTAATPPPPPPPGSRDPAGGGSATSCEPGSRREGEGAHGDAPCGCTWPSGPRRAGPALLLSRAPVPAAAVLEKHFFCPRVPTSRLPFIANSELKCMLPLLPHSSCGPDSALRNPEPPPPDSGMFRLRHLLKQLCQIAQG